MQPGERPGADACRAGDWATAGSCAAGEAGPPWSRDCGLSGWEGRRQRAAQKPFCPQAAPHLWPGRPHPSQGPGGSNNRLGHHVPLPDPDYFHLPEVARARPLGQSQGPEPGAPGGSRGAQGPGQERSPSPGQSCPPPGGCQPVSPSLPTEEGPQPTLPTPLPSPHPGPGEELAAAPRGLRVPARAPAGAGPAALREGSGEEGGGRGHHMAVGGGRAPVQPPLWICSSGGGRGSPGDGGAVPVMVTVSWPPDLRTFSRMPPPPPEPLRLE